MAVARGRGEPAERSRFLPMAARWRKPLSAPPVSPPVIAGDVTVVPLQAKGILAVDSRNGDERWLADVSAAWPISADEERVFVPSRDAVHALRLSSGEPIWRADVGTLTATPLAHGGWVVAASGAAIVALRAADGTEVWRRSLGAVEYRPAIDGDMLFVPLVDGRLVAIDLPTGDTRWERRLGGPVGEPLAIGGAVYAGADDKHFHVLDAATGETRWTYRIGAAPRGRAAADDDHVYYVAVDNVLWAFDRGSGANRWRKGLTYRPSAGPVLVGSALLVPGAVKAFPVFGRDGAALTDLKFPSTLVGVSNVETGPSTYPMMCVITGDLENPWTMWLIEGSSDPPDLPIIPLAVVPGTTIAIAPPG